MTLNDEVRKVIENHNEEIIDLICSYIEKNEYDIPTIGYTENQDGETLYINGREKLSRKHLYPMDILYALEEEGLIEFEK